MLSQLFVAFNKYSTVITQRLTDVQCGGEYQQRTNINKREMINFIELEIK